MACYEVAALRLSMHTLLGDRPATERTHEEEELGVHLEQPGALKSLSQAKNMAEIVRALDAASVDLEQRVADMPADAPSLGYYRALVVTVKRTQADFARISTQLERYYHDLDEVHDVLHEVFPESD
ncbi:MAG: hypothetical protein ACI9VR_005173 [Cognaticolwellia sp.]|jgi:hypothetical protein